MRLALLSVVALVAAGCLSSPHDDPATPALSATSPLTAFLHGLSPRDPDVEFSDARLVHDRIAVEEGVDLDSYVALPPGDGPFPLVMTLTPYYPGGAPTGLGRLGNELLARGYAVGKSTVRGTGTSGGCFEQGSEQEAQDSAAVVEYLAAQPWSDGNVGLIGVSYEGTTPMETWIEAPPHLKTVVPIAGITDFYKYNFVNGVPIFIQGYGFNTYYWAFEDVLFNMGPPNSQDPQELAAALTGAPCQQQAEVQAGGAGATATGDKDAYWDSRDFVARLADRVAAGNVPTASMYYVHGLQDWNVKPHMEEGWLEAVAATGVPFKQLYGQWPHAWPQSTAADAHCAPTAEVPVAACRNDWWNQTLVAWFDQFLKGKDTGILDAPRVQVQDDDGVWHHEDAWPPADAERWLLHPGASGTLGAAPRTGTATYLNGGGDNAVGGTAGVSADPATDATAAPVDVRFRSDPLREDVRLAGYARFTGNATSSGPRATLGLTLAEERPDGSLRPFGFAALSLNHAGGLASGKASIANERVPFSVRFFPQDDVAHKGNRLVLVAAGNVVLGDQPGPALQPVPGAGTVTLDLAGAVLDLPVDRTTLAEDPQPFDPAED